jgi:hypothetical protein
VGSITVLSKVRAGQWDSPLAVARIEWVRQWTNQEARSFSRPKIMQTELVNSQMTWELTRKGEWGKGSETTPTFHPWQLNTGPHLVYTASL